MGLPAGEQRVLDTIENELRITDQHLAAAFAAFPFTRFASGTRMPRPERLIARHRARPQLPVPATLTTILHGNGGPPGPAVSRGCSSRPTSRGDPVARKRRQAEAGVRFAHESLLFLPPSHRAGASDLRPDIAAGSCRGVARPAWMPPAPPALKTTRRSSRQPWKSGCC